MEFIGKTMTSRYYSHIFELSASFAPSFLIDTKLRFHMHYFTTGGLAFRDYSKCYKATTIRGGWTALLPTTLIFQNQIGESLPESYLILVVANFTLEKMGVKVDEIVEVFKKKYKKRRYFDENALCIHIL